jgi:SprT protein
MPSAKKKPPRQRLAPSARANPQVSILPLRGTVLPQSGVDHSLTHVAREWLRALREPELASRVVVEWNGRLVTTAGTACPRTGGIELNPLLRTLGPAQVRRTLRHELAHLIAHWRAGRRHIQTHGTEWRAACAELGIPNEPAFHELPLPRKRLPRKLAYRCRHCGFTVLRVRPFSACTACLKCCNRLNKGNYHADFLFLRIPFPPAPEVR